MLTEKKIGELEKLGWEYDEPAISKDFEFEDFAEAMEFVNEVAEVAEDQEHHPDIDIRYNIVRLEIFTHSEETLTRKDYDFARAVEEI